MVLNNPVLVLNASWTAIRVRTVKEALKLVFAERARIVTSDYQTYIWDEWLMLPVEPGMSFIQSATMQVRCPEGIVLLKYHKVPQMTRITKQKIYMRDNGICQYTGKKLSRNEATVDHIIPRSKGGKFSWENTALCCKEINVKKANRTPEEAGLKLIKSPTSPVASILLDRRKKYPAWWAAFIELPSEEGIITETKVG